MHQLTSAVRLPPPAPCPRQLYLSPALQLSEAELGGLVAEAMRRRRGRRRQLRDGWHARRLLRCGGLVLAQYTHTPCLHSRPSPQAVEARATATLDVDAAAYVTAEEEAAEGGSSAAASGSSTKDGGSSASGSNVGVQAGRRRSSGLREVVIMMTNAAAGQRSSSAGEDGGAGGGAESVPHRSRSLKAA